MSLKQSIAARHARNEFTEEEILQIAARRDFTVSRHAPDQAYLRGQVYRMKLVGLLTLTNYNGRNFTYRKTT